MRIGEIAHRSGIPAHTIRFYEDQKLVTRVARSDSGHRLYSEQILNELAFIRRAQRLGFSLVEIREILGIGRGGRTPCGRVAALCAAHLKDIEERMTELRAFRNDLRNAERQANTGCGFTSDGFCRAIMGLPEKRSVARKENGARA
jgi:DNA-binding transcriptional MerR regulator